MPTVLRTAEIEWTGSIARGSDSCPGSGAITDLPLTIASRIVTPRAKRAPRELIAAAHAGCHHGDWSILAAQGTPPERLNVIGTVTLEGFWAARDCLE